MGVGVDSGVGTGVEVGVAVEVGVGVEAGVGAGVDSGVGTGVEVGAAEEVGVRVEAADVDTPFTPGCIVGVLAGIGLLAGTDFSVSPSSPQAISENVTTDIIIKVRILVDIIVFSLNRGLSRSH